MSRTQLSPTHALPLIFLTCLLLPANTPAQQNIGGKTYNVTLTNRSDRSLQVLRGGRPGEGNNAGDYNNFPNRTGAIRPNSTITVPSVQGRVWSFMLNNKLVASYTTTTRGNQSFTIRQAQVNAALQDGGAAPQGGTQPSQRPDMMAQQGAVTVTLTNGTGAPINVATQDAAGQLQLVGAINANQASPVQATPGMTWYFLNQSNQLVGSYQTTAAVTQNHRIGWNTPSNPPPSPVNNKGGQIAENNSGKETGSKFTSAQANALVKYHNDARNEGRIRNPKVKWSNKIARYAQQRANSIAAARQYPPRHLPQGQNPYGENLAAGKASGQVQTVESLYTQWKTKEIGAFKQLGSPRTFNNQLAANVMQVGHYTQMIWQGTKEVGAGVVSWQEGGWTVTVVVCCYSPAGNMVTGTIY